MQKSDTSTSKGKEGAHELRGTYGDVGLVDAGSVLVLKQPV